MQGPKVSIITPSFNQGLFLEETILSVLNQSYANIEYIVIDGGSSDHSIEIIKKYQHRIAYWTSEEDKGQAQAINKGFKKASGDYLCWINSDDVLYPDFIARRMQEFANAPGVGLIYGDVDQGWQMHQKIVRRGRQQSYDEMLHTCEVKVPQMSAVWSRAAFTQAGLLDEGLNVLLDWEYILRTAGRSQILYKPGSVAFFRQHQQSKSVKYNQVWAVEMEQYYLALSAAGKLKKRTLVNLYFFCAGLYFENNEASQAQACLQKARQLSPALFLNRKITLSMLRLLVSIKKAIT